MNTVKNALVSKKMLRGLVAEKERQQQEQLEEENDEESEQELVEAELEGDEDKEASGDARQLRSREITR